MEILLFGGAQNTGKSSAILRLCHSLSNRYSPTEVIRPEGDISILLNGINQKEEQVKILLHSATDTQEWIDALDKKIESDSPDVVITAIRNDPDSNRSKVQNVLNKRKPNNTIEFPLGKVVKGQALTWYEQQIDALVNHLISLSPFYL